MIRINGEVVVPIREGAEPYPINLSDGRHWPEPARVRFMLSWLYGGDPIARMASPAAVADLDRLGEAGAMSYAEFLTRKAMVDPMTGIADVPALPDALFPFQRDITTWALKRGRAAIFAGTGLGKSLMELAWASVVARETGKPVLHSAPLAVSAQLVREARKFGLDGVGLARSQREATERDNITNYQKLEHFDVSAFGGVILDESSILKSQDGHYRTRLIEACAQIPFRLAATATPAPNDFMELGNHAEFLGVMSYTDMLATFFTHDGGETQKWRLKGHAENDFWRWMASWAVMLRKPSDLGYANDGYDLPPLHRHVHVVPATHAPEGQLFAFTAETLQERLAARRSTVPERVALAASITPTAGPVMWWCNLNAESEALTAAIHGAVETKGTDSDEMKERKLLDFAEGRTRVLVSKAQVAGYGMNFQHCAWTGFVGLNDSFEQVYQAVRRFWRFGQERDVHAHFIASELEGNVLQNQKRKEADAERMAAAMVLHTADLSAAAIKGMVRERPAYDPQIPMLIPSWLEAA